MTKIGIVALARRLLIELWRSLLRPSLPEGAILLLSSSPELLRGLFDIASLGRPVIAAGLAFRPTVSTDGVVPPLLPPFARRTQFIRCPRTHDSAGTHRSLSGRSTSRTHLRKPPAPWFLRSGPELPRAFSSPLCPDHRTLT